MNIKHSISIVRLIVTNGSGLALGKLQLIVVLRRVLLEPERAEPLEMTYALANMTSSTIGFEVREARSSKTRELIGTRIEFGPGVLLQELLSACHLKFYFPFSCPQPFLFLFFRNFRF